MGVDLRLLPVEADWRTWGFAHTVLSLERNSPLFEAIELQHPSPRPSFNLSAFCGGRVPDGSARGEQMYGVVKETPYGETLTYMARSELIAVLERAALGPATQAALAWLRESNVTWVGLYWH